MESEFRAALITWLRSGEELTALVNRVEEEAPLSASPPWLGIVASASTDWSTKDRTGREIRVALECVSRADQPRRARSRDAASNPASDPASASEAEASESELIAAIERRITAMPREQGSFALINAQFLKARSEKRPRNIRACLIEYRFRVLAVPEQAE